MLTCDILKFDSGNISRAGYYKNGIKHGQWVSFFENGIIHWIGNYLNGVELGIWKEWYESGELKEECYYVDNSKIPINFWDSEGNKTLENGTGFTIEKFGANFNDVYKHHFVNGVFEKEEKIQGVVYGKFIPNK